MSSECHTIDNNETSRSIHIDVDDLNKMGYPTPETGTVDLLEQFRFVKMQLIAKAFKGKSGDSKSLNSIMVTSAVNGEGKTFISLNIALSIASEYNHTVLYIDGDVSRKTSTELLKLNDHQGLTDYLADDTQNLADLFVHTDLPNLTILPSGKYHENVTELYASNRMHTFMQELSQRYNNRLIIYDSASLLQDSSASVLAHNADQIVFVIEAEKTPKHIIETALRSIKDCENIALILNKSNQRASV